MYMDWFSGLNKVFHAGSEAVTHVSNDQRLDDQSALDDESNEANGTFATPNKLPDDDAIMVRSWCDSVEATLNN